MSEEERIAKQMIAVTKAAAQSGDPKYRKAAEKWRGIIEGQLAKLTKKATPQPA